MKNVVLSLGMGVESVAIFLRWIYEPQTRPCTLEIITVITSQTGDDFLDTARDMTNHILPLMREHRIRYRWNGTEQKRRMASRCFPIHALRKSC